jgi:hypothetical protein
MDDYFRRHDLTARQRNLLVMRNLDKLGPVISARYERGEVSVHSSPAGRPYPRIDLTAADLDQAPGKLTDSVLDVDASAGFQAAPTPPPEPIPLQGAGPHFTIGAAVQIALAPPSELDAAGNHLERIQQFLPLVRRAAGDLADTLNRNQFALLWRNLADYRAAIAANDPEIPWGVVFGLGVRLANAADAAQRQIEDRLLPALEDPAQEALQSLIVLHASLIVSTVEGRELEEQADRLQMTREQQGALRADAAAIAAALHIAPEVIEPQADKVVTQAAEVIGEGLRAERGTVYGIATFKHATTVLISAAALAAFVPTGLILGGALGASVAGGAAWIGYKALENTTRYKAVRNALGGWLDKLHELEEGAVRQQLTKLAPFRQFVIRNEQLLRHLASNTPQMRWMLSYIDFVVPQQETNTTAAPSGDFVVDDRSSVPVDAHTVDITLSIDEGDPECVAEVPVHVFGQAGTIEGCWLGTSIRGRVQVKSGATLEKVLAYITKIERLTVDGEWEDSKCPQVQTIWTDTNDIITNIPLMGIRYFNIIHVNGPDDKITIWQRPMLSASLEDFFAIMTKYRFTVSVMAQGATGELRIEVDWKGNWKTIKVRPV